MSGLFENIKILMEPSLENKNIELNFEIDTPDLNIEIDTYLIEQVLINLILNSVEACREIKNPQINNPQSTSDNRPSTILTRTLGPAPHTHRCWYQF